MDLLILILIILLLFSPITIKKETDENGITNISIKCGKKNNKSD